MHKKPEVWHSGEHSISDIWKIEDANNMIVALNGYLSEKCQYGDNPGALSSPERILFVAQTLEAEVNNGGFAQFFYNSSGAFSGELVHAFREIGADRTAEICQKALSAFDRELPVDSEEREAMLDELESDEINEILEQCDNAFFQYEDDLTALNYAYIMKHKAAFT